LKLRNVLTKIKITGILIILLGGLFYFIFIYGKGLTFLEIIFGIGRLIFTILSFFLGVLIILIVFKELIPGLLEYRRQKFSIEVLKLRGLSTNLKEEGLVNMRRRLKDKSHAFCWLLIFVAISFLLAMFFWKHFKW
jgi:hypothetical protein